MAKNLIFLVIDSVDQQRLEGSRRRHSPAPFLHELRKNAIWTSYMFSQGPYTEAALTSLLCGIIHKPAEIHVAASVKTFIKVFFSSHSHKCYRPYLVADSIT